MKNPLAPLRSPHRPQLDPRHRLRRSRSCGLPACCWRFARRPTTKLSSTRTVRPSAIRRSTRWLPIKPAPPVTRSIPAELFTRPLPVTGLMPLCVRKWSISSLATQARGSNLTFQHNHLRVSARLDPRRLCAELAPPGAAGEPHRLQARLMPRNGRWAKRHATRDLAIDPARGLALGPLEWQHP